MSLSSLSPFSAFLVDKYFVLQASAPHDSPRKRKLRLVQDFWSLSPSDKERYTQVACDLANHANLCAALQAIEDQLLEEDDSNQAGKGIIVRTDFGDDEAWEGFLTALKDAERDLISPGEDASVEVADQPESESDDDESEEDMNVDEPETRSSRSSTSMFTLIAPLASEERPDITGISNIRALRLFNDAEVVFAPKPSQGTHRIRPGNRLIDLGGLIEVYTGNLVWIYDAQSNRDRSVRLINQKSEIYGSATADSWRPRVSFLPELQLNLVSGAMKIDFGGLDRWDYTERQRNLVESEKYPI